MAGERVNRVTDHSCFGCGERNPIGLKLTFFRQGEAVEASFTPRPEHEGYIGLVHGGIVATLLDEAMSWAVISATGRLMVTARMAIAFRRPVAVGQPLRVRGWVEQQERRLVRARAEVRDAACRTRPRRSRRDIPPCCRRAGKGLEGTVRADRARGRYVRGFPIVGYQVREPLSSQPRATRSLLPGVPNRDETASRRPVACRLAPDGQRSLLRRHDVRTR